MTCAKSLILIFVSMVEIIERGSIQSSPKIEAEQSAEVVWPAGGTGEVSPTPLSFPENIKIISGLRQCDELTRAIRHLEISREID